MKKFVTILALSLSIVASTAAQAETRPAPTEFSASVAGDIDDDEDVGAVPDRLWLLILLGVGGLAGLLAAAGSHLGNSPR